MISSLPKLQLWYFNRPYNNLETLFPDNYHVKLVNHLLAMCVVEEEDCLTDATSMLGEIDNILKVLSVDVDIISVDIERPCKACGLGRYKIIVDQDQQILRGMGFPLQSGRNYKFFACENCGYVQLFYIRDEQLPSAWQ